MKKGVLDLVVLAMVDDKDAYGYEIYHEIDKTLGISESTIYPILRRMVKEGLLETYLQESSGGPPRKYFRITAAGKVRFRHRYSSWKDFIEAVEHLIER